MRIHLRTAALILLLLSTLASAESPIPVRGGDGTDAALDRLHDVGQRMKDFDADVTLTNEDPVFGNNTSRIGKVWYQTKPDGDARIKVNFLKKVDNDTEEDERVEYVLDGGWLVDRTYDKKIEIRRQVSKPGEKINLLKLGEGPFPLPIGQDKQEVHKLFDVKGIEPAQDDPKGTTHLVLTPKAETQFADKFKAIDVWVSDDTGMPRRIRTTDPRENVTITDLENVRLNPGLKDADFQLEPVEGWDLKTEEFEQ